MSKTTTGRGTLSQDGKATDVEYRITVPDTEYVGNVYPMNRAWSGTFHPIDAAGHEGDADFTTEDGKKMRVVVSGKGSFNGSDDPS